MARDYIPTYISATYYGKASLMCSAAGVLKVVRTRLSVQHRFGNSPRSSWTSHSRCVCWDTDSLWSPCVYSHGLAQLRDYWKDQITTPDEPATIEVTSGLSKATLDVIGLAGFNYTFDALDPSGKPNELNQAFTSMFRALTANVPGFWMLIKFVVPALRIFVSIDSAICPFIEAQICVCSPTLLVARQRQRKLLLGA